MHYKSGYIHRATIDGREVVRVQVSDNAMVRHVKSIRAAKALITKYSKQSRIENLMYRLDGK